MPLPPTNSPGLRTKLPLLIAALVIAGWFVALGPSRIGSLLGEQWPITLTMVFGSFIAGASSEGGGAVAFPVFTKVLSVAPADAKLFALMIQAVGMTAAAVAILALRVRIDAKAARLASLGGAVGVAVGLLAVAPVAPSTETRVLFTAMQAGFGVVLLMVMRQPGARTAAARLTDRPRGSLVVMAGVLGGVVSGLVGSGLDLAIFAVLTLRFGVSEKVATPTSVVVMAVNSLVAVACYRWAIGPAPSQVTEMWLAAVPVVVIGAPLGAWFCSQLRRTTIASGLLLLIATEVVSTMLLVPATGSAVVVGGLVFAGCVVVCLLMALRRDSATSSLGDAGHNGDQEPLDDGAPSAA